MKNFYRKGRKEFRQVRKGGRDDSVYCALEGIWIWLEAGS